MATASGMTDVAAKALLNFLLRGTSMGTPAAAGNWYAALFTSAPTAAGGGTECAYTNYARIPLVVGSTDFSAASGTGTVLVTNNSLKNFGANGSGSTVTIVGWGICLSLSGALSTDMWFFGQYAGVAIPVNEVPQLGATSWTIELVSGSSTSGFTDYAASAILTNLFIGTAMGNPSTWYFGLQTAASSPSSVGTETTYTGYARQSGAVGTSLAAAASGAGAVSTTITPVITFPANTGASATMLGFGLFDALTSGHEWIFGPLTSTAIATNIQPQFAAGTITITATSQA
jgi:hypothetical protein